MHVSEPVDETWATIIGDTLHNVRSALDSVTWTIVTKHMSRDMTEAEGRRVVFPIRDSDEEFAESRWAPSDLPGDVRNAFRAVQSFYYPTDGGLEKEAINRWAANHALTQLRELSNQDKHRGLHPVVCGLDFMWAGLPKGATCSYHPADPPPWGEGSVMVIARFEGLTEGAAPEFGHRFEIALADDIDVLRAVPVVGRLKGLIQTAGFTILRLLPLA